QPGQTPPTPQPDPTQPDSQPYPQPQQPQPYPQPYPQQCPPPGCGAAYGYQAIPLSPADQELLADGEISDGAHVGGGLLAIFFGFGVGQAVQGRFGETGWIFLLGEGASFTALLVGLGDALQDCSMDQPN